MWQRGDGLMGGGGQGQESDADGDGVLDLDDLLLLLQCQNLEPLTSLTCGADGLVASLSAGLQPFLTSTLLTALPISLWVALVGPGLQGVAYVPSRVALCADDEEDSRNSD